MATLNEILKENGLEEQAITAVLEAMKANKIYTASEENLDIRYGKLKEQHAGVVKERDTANKLIEELKNASVGQEDMQKQILAYEQQVAKLQEQLTKTKIEAEARLRLSEANALDVPYMLYKLNEHVTSEGKQLEVDENGKIKDWDSLLTALKTQNPKHFAKDEADGDGYEVFEPLRLKGTEGGNVTVTKERFNAMNYEERMALKQSNEKRYNELAK